MPSSRCDPVRFQERALELRLECERIRTRNQESIGLTRTAIRRSASRLSSNEPAPSSRKETRD
jgi:hypothetical protein